MSILKSFPTSYYLEEAQNILVILLSRNKWLRFPVLLRQRLIRLCEDVQELPAKLGEGCEVTVCLLLPPLPLLLFEVFLAFCDEHLCVIVLYSFLGILCTVYTPLIIIT